MKIGLEMPEAKPKITEIPGASPARAQARGLAVMGLDLSLTRTGYALPDGTPGVLIPPKPESRGMPRLAWIRDRIYELVRRTDTELVVIEGYAMGMGRDAQNHAMGELGGIVRLMLFERDVPYVDVAPASLKRYATGKGNAKKEFVLVEAVKRLGYSGSDNNESDALWLRHMALDHYVMGADVAVSVRAQKIRADVMLQVHGFASMPAHNREALVKIAWPALMITTG